MLRRLLRLLPALRCAKNGNGGYGIDVNSKAYKKGFKDGGHDRDKHRAARVSHKHWKTDQDRQAYDAGYDNAYRGLGNNNPRNNGRDRNDRQ